MYTKSTKFRTSFLFLTLIPLFAVLLIRLFYLQLGHFSFPRSNQQYKFTLRIKPQRGIIYDRNGKKLAVSLKVNSVYALPREIKDKVRTAKILSHLLNLPQEDLLKKFSAKSFVWVKRKVSFAEEEAIRKALSEGVCPVRKKGLSKEVENAKKTIGLKEFGVPYKISKGVYFLPEEKRFYPQGQLAAHLLGFCDIDNKGLEGIELFYDSYLRGREGWRFSEKDAHRSEIVAFEKRNIPPVNGYSLLLTIDIVIQYIVEKELKKTVEEFRPLSATVIVLNPQNGDILALANYPTYDPNSFSSFSPSFYRNRAITDFFEPGSVFKIVTASAALEERVVKLEDTFYCEKGKYHFKGGVLHDYHPYGKLTFSEVIEKSSNIGISKIAQILGKEKLYEFILKFGFGSTTGIDLPGETEGLVNSPKEWSDISILNIPMGQGVGVTSLQLVRAISAIANGGELIQPHLVKEIRDEKGEKIKSFSFSRKRIISRETASEMREILQRAVERGTGKNARIKGYKVAGKTGTAQKVNPKGGYYKDKFIASFIGFLPADDPLISIVVVIDEPQGAHFGSVVAAPLFQRIGRQVMEYLK